MKRNKRLLQTSKVACADIAQATRVRALQNLRPLAGDRIRLDQVKKTLQTLSGKTFFVIEKNAIRNQFFVKLFPLCFHLSAFEATSIKTSNPALCRQK